MSDEFEIAKLRTASPASGTVDLIARCHWAYARIVAIEAENVTLHMAREEQEEWLHDMDAALKAADALANAMDFAECGYDELLTYRKARERC